jgi:uncharacterized repeat protein (TIGR01451 family)
MRIVLLLPRLAFAAAVALLLATQAAHACTGGGCVVAGPRLASVNSSQGVLLNALLGSLTNSTVNVSALDWNAVAGGNVSLLGTLKALEATLGVSSASTALNTPITLGQLTGALSTAASQAGNTSLSASLGNVAANLGVPGTITLGSLLSSDGIVGTTQINALGLISGAVQLYNTQNVATTPTPITVSGVQLGQSALASITLQVQAVEPPVYVCGPVGTTFHSAALRVKLGITAASTSLDTSALSAALGSTTLTLATFTVYVEVAEATGVITAVNAITNAMTVQATPGIASIYLGTISDLNFFNRSRALNVATDLTPGTIASLVVGSTTIGVYAQAAVTGTAPTPTTLNFSGAGVQTQTASTSGLTATTLLTSLVGNLQVTISPSLGNVLDGLVLPLLSGIISSAVTPILETAVPGVLDPLLSDLGIQIGQVTVSSGGTYLVCAVSGCVYADANHNARQDSGETGTGTTLYAKLINPATPTVAAAVVSVDPTTGNYSFPTLNPATYTVVISTASATSTTAALAPAGWIGTQAPTLTLSVTVAAADLTGQSFGLYHGSTLAGTVFKDNGSGGGAANNGVRDGAESALAGVTVNVTDSSGATVWDTEKSDPTGAYVAWIPATAGSGVLKVTQASDATMVFVSGSPGTTGGAFAQAGATTSFTHVLGSVYTGVNFGDVPINRLDTDGQQSVAAGTTALYPHVFHAGSAGQLSFAVAPSTAPPTGWSATVYLDANCNGQLDAADTLLTAATAVTADQALCIIVKVFVPQTAANETRITYALTASFAYANNALTGQAQRQDLTIVGSADGLQLVKSVDKTVAASGAVITYTITYTNLGASAVSAVKIHDATPAWTVLGSAACGALPAGITACNVTAQPAAGAAGSLEWTLTGSLPSAGTGAVVFTVTVQ